MTINNWNWKQQIPDIQLTLLKSKEKNLSKYEEPFKIIYNEKDSEDDLSSEDTSFTEKSKFTYIKEWTNHAGNINLSQMDNAILSCDIIEDLSKFINNMLARQTIWNNMMTFDGSSSLKWPIYYSQKKLSNEAYSFSTQENVLRLTKSLAGETRRTVEMFFIATQKPDEILDILENTTVQS